MLERLVIPLMNSSYALPVTAAAVLLLGYMLVVSCSLVGRVRLLQRPAAAPLITDEGPALGDRLDVAVMEQLARQLSPTVGWGNGRRLAVLFAAPGCAPCRDLLPQLAAVARRWRGDTRLLVVLETAGISESHPSLREWTEQPLPILRDEQGELTGTVGIRSRPYALLVDPTGLVLMKGVVSSGEHVESLMAEHGVAAGERTWKPVRGMAPASA